MICCLLDIYVRCVEFLLFYAGAGTHKIFLKGVGWEGVHFSKVEFGGQNVRGIRNQL